MGRQGLLSRGRVLKKRSCEEEVTALGPVSCLGIDMQLLILDLDCYVPECAIVRLVNYGSQGVHVNEEDFTRTKRPKSVIRQELHYEMQISFGRGGPVSMDGEAK